VAAVLAWDLLAVLALAGYAVFQNTDFIYRSLSPADDVRHAAPFPEAEDEAAMARIEKDAAKAFKKLTPRGPHVVIDRVHNRLSLWKADALLLEAPISCGAGSRLTDAKTGREWTFDTPVGRFRVVNRREYPVWVAPDWEFIETNEPIPKSRSARVQEGMLGEYALDLNIPGYMIHGTLYSRLLGRSVSHGCIRVGRDDLRVIWRKVPVGSTVFIF
jgi:L,D-transpeptidase YbiS